MPIPTYITREHILQAASELEAAESGSFQASTKYDAWINGKTYPPKALIVRASHHIPGSPITSNAFPGGDESGQANRFLRSRGVPVYPKGTDGPSQVDYPEDSSRFGYLAWMLRDAAVYRPRNAFDCRKAFREAAYLLLGLATTGDHRGQTIENYYEAVNKRQIDVARGDFYDAMAEAVRGDTTRLTDLLGKSPAYSHIFGTPRWKVMDQAIAALAAGGLGGRRTYRLLTFNPSNKDYNYSLEDWSSVVAKISANKIAEDDWSTGSTTSVVEGDPFFILCQGAGPRGIVGQAVSTSDSWQDDEGRNRVNISIDWATERPLTSLETTALEARFPEYRWSPQGSGQTLDPAIADFIAARVAEHPMTADDVTPALLCRAFTQALTTTGLSFGDRTDHFVRAFLASAATKRFVILTGLSGSGKTQIAMKLGEWLGEDAYMVVPVRPDWTGSEALFGYENVLAEPSDDGRRPWQVPPTLAFMLQAVANPRKPYLLLLDEMNLAHVERYFADVLSGIESGKACLPNLEKDTKGAWLQSATQPMVPFPSNLFVVGTVNVDETTYMFSPKVLDRANTIEFRVQTSDLASDPLAVASIAPCPQGAPAHTQGLRALAEDSSSHLTLAPTWLEAFTADLRTLHALLSRYGLEFGHRTFSESIRFACIHTAMLDEDEATGSHEQQLDLVVLQKVLPRLHGSRRRLEPVLCALASFAKQPGDKAKDSFDPLGNEAADPTLPKTMNKLQRMTRLLRDNQFVSFAE